MSLSLRFEGSRDNHVGSYFEFQSLEHLGVVMWNRDLVTVQGLVKRDNKRSVTMVLW